MQATIPLEGPRDPSLALIGREVVERALHAAETALAPEIAIRPRPPVRTALTAPYSTRTLERSTFILQPFTPHVNSHIVHSFSSKGGVSAITYE